MTQNPEIFPLPFLGEPIPGSDTPHWEMTSHFDGDHTLKFTLPQQMELTDKSDLLMGIKQAKHVWDVVPQPKQITQGQTVISLEQFKKRQLEFTHLAILGQSAPENYGYLLERMIAEAVEECARAMGAALLNVPGSQAQR